MCVGPDGTVWAGVAASLADRGQELHLVSYRPGEPSCHDHGPLAISNPNYTERMDAQGKPLPWHHGVEERPDGVLVPRHSIMGICAARDGTVYATTLAPFTLARDSPRPAEDAEGRRDYDGLDSQFARRHHRGADAPIAHARRTRRVAAIRNWRRCTSIKRLPATKAASWPRSMVFDFRNRWPTRSRWGAKSSPSMGAADRGAWRLPRQRHRQHAVSQAAAV